MRRRLTFISSKTKEATEGFLSRAKWFILKTLLRLKSAVEEWNWKQESKGQAGAGGQGRVPGVWPCVNSGDGESQWN